MQKTTLLCNTFSKEKSIWIEFKGRYKLTNNILHHIPIIVKSPIY